jgi:hypothetical protein
MPYDWSGNLYDQVEDTGGTTGGGSTMGGDISDFFGNITSGNFNKALNTIGSVLKGTSSAGTVGQLAGVTGLGYLLQKLTGGSGTNPNVIANRTECERIERMSKTELVSSKTISDLSLLLVGASW